MAFFDIVFVLIFCATFGIILYAFVNAARREINNNRSPRLTVTATVVTKRRNESSHYHSSGNACAHRHYSTNYYVTFQVQSGDRLELNVGANEIGYLVEGDYGNLSFQGTRFLGFERIQ